MTSERNIREGIRKLLVLNNLTIIIVLAAVFGGIIVVVYYSQRLSEQTSLAPIITTGSKEQYEISKLAAEMSQIRSDTNGSLFWLKLIALLVTVGGAVGGYLFGQSRSTKRLLEFENRKNVDAVYQAIVQELSAGSPLLRAAAAVKLGQILKSFPYEWAGEQRGAGERKEQLIQLTKQVLAASLTIEGDSKVLKTLSISLVLHKRWENDRREVDKKDHGDGRNLDLSGAKAENAFWAKVDFSHSDFFEANLVRASLRSSIIHGAVFCKTKLGSAVLANTQGQGANFKEANLGGADLTAATLQGATFELADLRSANLTGAALQGASFEQADLRGADLRNAKLEALTVGKETLQGTSFARAKVHGCKLAGALAGGNPDSVVDDSPAGDGTVMINALAWLKRETETPSIS